MTDNRATEQQLDALHGLVAESFINEIRRYKEAGEPIPAALLAQAAKFLKDNGVDRAIRPGDPLDVLDQELPDLKVVSYG